MPRTLDILLFFLSTAAAHPSHRPGCDAYRDCVAASTRNFAWTVVGFDFHASYIFTTPAHQNSWGYVNFNLSNPALDQPAVCSASSDQLENFFYGDISYDCASPAGAAAPSDATFSFSQPSGLLAVNQTWVCPDAETPAWS